MNLPFIGSKQIKINFRQCHSFIVNNDKIEVNIDEQLSCPQHEEADTKIIYHLCNITQANIVVKCSDTDVAVIMLGNMHHMKHDNSHVWILTGVGNKQRYVDITKIYEHLGSSLCRSLPGFHAFTGCDYNPAFFKRGKQRPFNILKKNVEYQQAFLQFGEVQLFTDDDTKRKVLDVMQKFICDVYNVHGIHDVNAARLQLFIDTYTVSDVSEKFNRKSVRNFDSCNLPPCKSELLQQFCRANYIASIWNNAHTQNLPGFSPENNGWTLDENQYKFYWFDGDQLPSLVSELLENESEDSNNDNNDDDDLNIEIQDWSEDGSRNSYEADNED